MVSDQDFEMSVVRTTFKWIITKAVSNQSNKGLWPNRFGEPAIGYLK